MMKGDDDDDAVGQEERQNLFSDGPNLDVTKQGEGSSSNKKDDRQVIVAAAFGGRTKEHDALDETELPFQKPPHLFKMHEKMTKDERSCYDKNEMKEDAKIPSSKSEDGNRAKIDGLTTEQTEYGPTIVDFEGRHKYTSTGPTLEITKQEGGSSCKNDGDRQDVVAPTNMKSEAERSSYDAKKTEHGANIPSSTSADIQDGLTTDQTEYLLKSTLSTDRTKPSLFKEWMGQFKQANAGNKDTRPRLTDELLTAKAKELCVEARQRAGLDVPKQSVDLLTPLSFSKGTENVVRWKAVKVRWLVEIFMKTEEIEYLCEWQCPMWFVRNFCVVVILELRGVDWYKGGCIVDHIDKFPPLIVDGEACKDVVTDSTEKVKLLSYTGDIPLSEYIEHLNNTELEDSYIWSDVLGVSQREWRGRDDEEMVAFKEGFMFALHDWIGKVSAVVLLLDRWDDVSSTLGKIWVVWELYACTCGVAKLSVCFLEREKQRLVEEGFWGGFGDGLDPVIASLAKVDVRNAEAFNKEDKAMILGLMQKTEDGMYNVNSRVAGLFRDWLLTTGTEMYENEDDDKRKCVLANNVGSLQRTMGLYGEAEHSYTNCLKLLANCADPDATPMSFTVLSAMANLLHDQGRLKDAEPLSKEALEGCRELMGNKDLHTLCSINNMALLLLDQGKLEEAKPLLVEALEGCCEVLGNKHPGTLASKANLASLLKDQGRLKDAEPLEREALTGRRELLGSRHPDTLSSIHGLACLLFDQGKFEEAKPLAREALTGRRELLGSRHPDTLTSINSLACLLFDEGKFKEAKPLLVEALEGRRELLGNKHPETLQSIGALAGLLTKQGKLEEAEPFLVKALEGNRELLGNKHPDTLTSIENLAGLLRDQGKFEDAKPLLEEALEGHRELLGNKHPDTLFSINHMAMLLRDQGAFEEAKSLFREALEGMREFNNKHCDTFMVMNNLASLLRDEGKIEEAEPLMIESLAGWRESLGNKHPGTLLSINNMATLFRDRGMFEEAKSLFREALEGMRELLGVKHPNTLMVMNNLAGLLRDQGKIEEAEPLFIESLAGFRELLGNKHPETLKSINNLALLLHGQGKLKEARPLLKEAMEGMRELFGVKHPETLRFMHNMAVILRDQGKFEEAEPLFMEALEGLRELFGNKHFDVFILMKSLATSLAVQGKLEEAEPLYNEAVEGMREVLGNKHPVTLDSIVYSAAFQLQCGNLHDALSLCKEAKDGLLECFGIYHPSTMSAIYLEIVIVINFFWNLNWEG